MLIDVFAGRDSHSAAPWGSYHFARSPNPGEEVEIDGTLAIVTRAWHRPDIYYKGAKFAILVDEAVTQGPANVPVLEDAKAAV